MRGRNIEHRKRQTSSLLDEVLERRLALYALAAGAVLAVPGAQAKVVFTPSNAVLRFGDPRLDIDLNNDGVIDFTLTDGSVSLSSTCSTNSGSGRRRKRPYVCGETDFRFLKIYSLNGSGNNEIVYSPSGFPVALSKGTAIGDQDSFAHTGVLVGRDSKVRNGYFGNFFNVRERFLGVRIVINGETHYGWIGFRAVQHFTAALVGWAYETVPNKAIISGDKGQEVSAGGSVFEPTLLQLLAMGHTGIADRQRRIAA